MLSHFNLCLLWTLLSSGFGNKASFINWSNVFYHRTTKSSTNSYLRVRRGTKFSAIKFLQEESLVQFWKQYSLLLFWPLQKNPIHTIYIQSIYVILKYYLQILILFKSPHTSKNNLNSLFLVQKVETKTKRKRIPKDYFHLAKTNLPSHLATTTEKYWPVLSSLPRTIFRQHTCMKHSQTFEKTRIGSIWTPMTVRKTYYWKLS